MTGPVTAMVLAAGAGTRMRSERPKPLHVLCGRPMVLYSLDALSGVRPQRVVIVVGHGAEQITKRLQDRGPDHLDLDFVEQVEQRGTGHAVITGLTAFADGDDDDAAVLVVLYGDMPLLTAATVSSLVDGHRSAGAAATILTAVVDDPTGYGRIVRSRHGDVVRIVEQADADAEEREVKEINTGVYCFRRSILGPALRRLVPDNSQGELYLTDVVAVLREAGYPIATVVAADARETAGVNDRAQLASAEAELRARTNRRWLDAGVAMVDPMTAYIDTTVTLAPDVTIFPNTVLQGSTVVARGAELGPDTHLADCMVGSGAVVRQTRGEDAEIGSGAVVGPFASLGPGASVPDGHRTGPFYAAPTQRGTP